MKKHTILMIVGLSANLLLTGVGVWAQVFPPRQPQSPPIAMPTQPGQMPTQPAMPRNPGPRMLTMSIPLVTILGDPTKSFIQLGNMRSPFDSNFTLGRGLAGRIVLEKYTHEAGNGQK